ncbi:MAG TPA: hypothetical protein VFO16_06365 [Pseudonocardiaceae bacterium]|nr:hypothetical protein [Pseudonocardiaceae bacterium]
MTAVHYLLAAIGLAGITVLVWKALRPQRPATGSVLAPDDDPEFLRGLNRKPEE